MSRFQFKAEQRFDKSLSEVFEFFSHAENLELITPPWLNFKILTALPIKMQTGTIIDYQIKLYGIPFRWKTEINFWEPPEVFIDTQIKGPYSIWIHEHRFAEQDGQTIMTDTVNYDIAAGFLSLPIHKLFLKKQIEKIFAYRRETINRYLAETYDKNANRAENF